MNRQKQPSSLTMIATILGTLFSQICYSAMLILIYSFMFWLAWNWFLFEIFQSIVEMIKG